MPTVGDLPMNFISWGMYDDPFAYDSYANMSKWREAHVTPGIVINGN
jgi:hypothetical protein